MAAARDWEGGEKETEAQWGERGRSLGRVDWLRWCGTSVGTTPLTTPSLPSRLTGLRVSALPSSLLPEDSWARKEYLGQVGAEGGAGGWAGHSIRKREYRGCRPRHGPWRWQWQEGHGTQSPPALPCPALPCPALPCPCRAHTESTDPSYFLDYAFGHGSHVVASLVGSVELPVVGTAPGVPGPFRDNNYTGACGRGRCGRGESEEWVVNGGGGGRGSGGAGGGGGGRVGVGGWGGWWGKWGWGFRSTCYEKAQSSMRGWVGKSVHTWA